MRRIALVLAAALVAAAAVMGGTLPARAEVDPYTTEGTHTVNGRQWRTTCEPYSQTTRCRTEIWATQIKEVNGRFVSKNGWAFNNLTYLPSFRGLWKNNPLGYTNQWTAKDGRRWNTECDTPATGRNGCRSYAQAKVIESSLNKGVRTYRWVTKSIFNNIVQFNGPTVTIPDSGLKACINRELGKPRGADIPLATVATIDALDCRGETVRDLRGLERFTNVTFLILWGSEVRDLSPLKSLKKLEFLDLSSNNISDVTGLASITSLDYLRLDNNVISDISPLRSLTLLTWLDLGNNNIKDLTQLSSLTKLNVLVVSGNQLTSLRGISGMKELTNFYASDNDIVDISALTSQRKLEVLFLDNNLISDITPLVGHGKLHLLDLSHNNITHVAPLANLPVQPPLGALEIYLWDNPIVDKASLDPLKARPNVDVYVLFVEP